MADAPAIATPPATGREVLSSRLTVPLQVGPILLWLADFYVLLWVLLHRFPGLQGLAHHPPLALATKLELGLLAVPLVLLPLLFLWASGLREMSTDGTDLVVTLASGRQVKVPLTAVSDVSERIGAELRTVKVTFDSNTKAGRSARFLAPTRFRVTRTQSHPVALALRGAVQAARSNIAAETRQFGRKEPA